LRRRGWTRQAAASKVGLIPAATALPRSVRPLSQPLDAADDHEERAAEPVLETKVTNERRT
jgi:hypothetical protein